MPKSYLVNKITSCSVFFITWKYELIPKLGICFLSNDESSLNKTQVSWASDSILTK